jgi:hypothetical protein
MLEQKFAIYFGIKPQHAPYHIVTSIYKNVYQIFEEDLKFMFQNRKIRRYDEYSHNLMFLYGMYTHYQILVLRKKTSFLWQYLSNFLEYHGYT